MRWSSKFVNVLFQLPMPLTRAQTNHHQVSLLVNQAFVQVRILSYCYSAKINRYVSMSFEFDRVGNTSWIRDQSIHSHLLIKAQTHHVFVSDFATMSDKRDDPKDKNLIWLCRGEFPIGWRRHVGIHMSARRLRRWLYTESSTSVCSHLHWRRPHWRTVDTPDVILLNPAGDLYTAVFNVSDRGPIGADKAQRHYDQLTSWVEAK